MKTVGKKQGSFLANVFQEKCPHCGQSHVFEQNTGLFQWPVMKERCDTCKYSYLREPGYFLGAMYISYAIAVFFGIITFLVVHFAFPALPTICGPMAIILVVALIAKKNFKLSRVIYMHLFPW